jgi:predicted  nucleic acid-binding Zn-ribbon protein
LQKECEKLTSDLARLQSQTPPVDSETELKTEISELRFDKEALESKLRKFATHCQRLEDDKAGMADALKSCNVDIEAYGSDISEAIIHLCDRLTSVEEAHSKSKFGRNLELQNSLTTENDQLRRRLEEVSSSESRLMEKLKTVMRESEELKNSLELQNPDTASASKDMGNKLRYLEQENLQLMVDIRATKKQLQNAREELESIRMNALDHNPTSGFGDVDFQTFPRRSRGTTSLDEGIAETSDTIELTNLARGYAIQKIAPSKRSPEGHKRKILSDNTNRAAQSDSTNARIEKQPRHRDVPAVPALKNERKRAKKNATPGLGESSSLESDSTGECKQS